MRRRIAAAGAGDRGTALNRYRRLEAEGVWRADPDAQRRDVIVSLGEASLVVSDRGERALAHWSLPAVERRGAGLPALYVPGPDAQEELEIADGEMVDAIDEVRAALARRQARPGRLRAVLFAGLAVLVAAAALLWLPDALIRHTAQSVPAATRAATGAALLDAIARFTGPPCASSAEHGSLARLNRRLRGPRAGPLVLVPGGATEALHLPGGAIVLRRTLVEDHDEPAVVAGHVLAEAVAAELSDPFLRLLRDAGLVAALRLLTSGALPAEALSAHAERLVTAPPAQPPAAPFLARLASAAVPATPYAYARDVTGETVLPLVEADPVPPGESRPILSDGDWVALQGACGG